MSLDLALGIARSGLAAVERSLAQASQNIGNAGTAGYTRKTVALQTVAVGDQAAGVRTGEAQRAVDAALDARLDQSRSVEAGATLRETLLQGIEVAQGPTDADSALPDVMAALQDSFIALRASPADSGLQRGALEAADSVAQRLNGLSDAIGDARQEAQNTIEREVTSINATLREIASLTAQIKSGLNQAGTAELEDRRDAAIAKLSESMEVRAVRQDNGDILLLAQGVAVLPLDPDSDLLSVSSAQVSAQSYYGAGGSLPGVMLQGLDITGSISGGRLGEAIALRDSTLPRMQAEVDLAATTLASRLEAEGLQLFTDSGGTAPPAASGAYAGSAQIGFAGRISVNPAVTANPALLRDGTHAVAGAAGGPTAFTPNPTGGPAGFTTLLDRVLDHAFGAEAASGVAWSAIPVSGLGPDGSLASPFLSPARIEDYATRITSTQAADRASATAAKQQAAALRSTLEERFQDQSGVDMDAEMAGMVTLQNAYAANARVMTVVQAMRDSLLATVR